VKVQLNDGELLWRRIHQDHVRMDGRVSSAAFSGVEMSVDVARIQADMSITLKNGGGIGEFETAIARSLGQVVVGDPDAKNPAHALALSEP
jgi:hypothetical protein